MGAPDMKFSSVLKQLPAVQLALQQSAKKMAEKLAAKLAEGLAALGRGIGGEIGGRFGRVFLHMGSKWPHPQPPGRRTLSRAFENNRSESRPLDAHGLYATASASAL